MQRLGIGIFAASLLVAACGSSNSSDPTPLPVGQQSPPAPPTQKGQAGISPDLLAYAQAEGIDVSKMYTAIQTVVTIHEDGTKTVVSHPITPAEQLAHSQEIVLRQAARANGQPPIREFLDEENCEFGSSGCSNCSGSSLRTDLFHGTLYQGSEICFYNAGTGVAWDDIADYSGECTIFIIDGRQTCDNHNWSPGAISSWASGDEASALTNSDDEGTWSDCGRWCCA